MVRPVHSVAAVGCASNRTTLPRQRRLTGRVSSWFRLMTTHRTGHGGSFSVVNSTPVELECFLVWQPSWLLNAGAHDRQRKWSVNRLVLLCSMEGRLKCYWGPGPKSIDAARTARHRY